MNLEYTTMIGIPHRARPLLARCALLAPLALAAQVTQACENEGQQWHTFAAVSLGGSAAARTGELLGSWHTTTGQEGVAAAAADACAADAPPVLAINGGQLGTLPAVDGAVGGEQGIYSTGVPGLGMIVQVRGGDGRWTAVRDGQKIVMASAGSSQAASMRVRLVRTGAVAPGQYTTTRRPLGQRETTAGSEILGVAGMPVAVMATPCTIDLGSDATVNLGQVAAEDFESIGSTSTAKEFSWTTQCDPSTPQTVDVTYTSLTAVTDAQLGRAAVSGGARGIEFEVRRAVTPGTPDGTPVAFGSAYDLGSSTANPGETLSVRYVRTGALSSGRADGGITIKLDYR